MARARYAVHCIGADQASFEYTYYHFAPAFFFARDPEDKEKRDFIQLLVDRYHPTVMAERSWGCISCGRQATSFVHRPTYSLNDAAALAVNNLLLPVCPARACHIGAASIMDAINQDWAQKYGLDSVGPEMLACENCHQLKETRFQRCGRCKGPPYCSVQCQKADWKRHKPNCDGRVEAMKLSSEELAQLDQYAYDITQGTGELKRWDHSGAFPEVQQEMGLGTQLEGFGVEKAKQRRRAMRKGQDELKEKLQTVTEGHVGAATAAFRASHEGQQLPDCFCIYQYFGNMQTPHLMARASAGPTSERSGLTHKRTHTRN